MTTSTITLDIVVKKQLDRLKAHRRESYNEVLVRLLKMRTLKHNHDAASEAIESIYETAEILSDPTILQRLAKSLLDLKEGRLYSIDEV